MNKKLCSALILTLIFTILMNNLIYSKNIDSNEWYPFSIPWDDTTDSPIHAGKLVLDAPAGKHGFLQVKDGHFYFENGKRIRFWGTNLCFSGNFPTHDEAEKMAGHMAKYGFNAVRLHHMDTQNSPSGIFDFQYQNTLVLDKNQLDRLDYFIHQLKLRGIYININLHVGRKFTENDGVVDADKLPKNSKLVTIFDPKLIELQKDYAKKLLDRVNPYTGLKYTNDPAIAMLEITNENSLFSGWYYNNLNTNKYYSVPEYYQNKLDSLWNQWLLNKYNNETNLIKAWNITKSFSDHNQVINGDFSTSHKSSWKEEIHTGKGAKATFTSAEGYLKAEINEITPESYTIQFKQNRLKLKKDVTYKLSFKAKADKPRQISTSYMKETSPWSNYGLYKTIDMDNNWNEYSAVFTCNTDDTETTRLSFGLGHSTGTVLLDDITLVEFNKYGLLPSENLHNATIKRQTFQDLSLYSNQRQKDLVNFYYQLEKTYYSDMLNYLKSDLGIKVPISSGNSYYGIQHLLAQSTGDYMNAHTYWDHPQFPNKPWDSKDFTQKNTSIIKEDYKNRTLFSGLIQSAVKDKPIIVSEWNIPYPNQYEYEIPMLMTTYALKQDWDGLFIFAYSHSNTTQKQPHLKPFFDIVNSPTKMVQMIPCAVSFINGYLKLCLASKKPSIPELNFPSTPFPLMGIHGRMC